MLAAKDTAELKLVSNHSLKYQHGTRGTSWLFLARYYISNTQHKYAANMNQMKYNTQNIITISW